MAEAKEDNSAIDAAADSAELETVTQWISALSRGDEGAADRVWPDVYAQLRRMAARRIAALPPGDTLQPTALVHEAYARIEGADGGERTWANRHHLIFAVARAMHDVLVERARAKAALKRGAGRRRFDLDSVQVPHEAPPDELLALSEALALLEREDARRHRIVMLRFFAGLDLESTARLLELSPRTIEREWRMARITLHQAIVAGSAGEQGAPPPAADGPADAQRRGGR